MKRLGLIALLLTVLVPAVLYAVDTIRVKLPAAIDVDEVVCTEAAVCTLTDQKGHREILIQNRTDQILCIEFNPAGCSGATITCAVDNTRDNDVYPLSAGATLTIPIMGSVQACGKLALADTLSEAIYVIERD